MLKGLHYLVVSIFLSTSLINNINSQEKERNSQDLRAIKDAWDYAKGFDKPFQLLQIKEKERYIASFLKQLVNNRTSDKYSAIPLPNN
jgi:hypothetical protein